MSIQKLIRWSIFTVTLLTVLILSSKCGVFKKPVDYNDEVKPILNKHCISCHGGVKKSGEFSLLSSETAFLPTESGHPAIIPGSPGESEMIKRIKSADPEERMPLESEPLSKEEIMLLERWIKEGAKWGKHWSYRTLEDSRPKSLINNSTVNDQLSKAIDFYVDKELKNLQLKRNETASKNDLIRRASLDIIGMLPDHQLKEDYINNKISYEDVVEKLLAENRYGEKWASMWLDIARYADSKGFERDTRREIWHYRDYVIKALNNDLPYDNFIIEQLAGDMLENPELDQLIATGFHRNTQTNDEGGTDNEEFRVKAVMDRVNTTWEGIMGTTMACVQCHGHPYDPIPHEDYYRSFAVLNNTRDADTHMDYPLLKLMDSVTLDEKKELLSWIRENADKDISREYDQFLTFTQPVIYSIEVDSMVNAALYDTKYLGLRNHGFARLPKVNLDQKSLLLFKGSFDRNKGRFEVRIKSHDGPVIGSVDLGNATSYGPYIEMPLIKTEGVEDIYLVYHDNTWKETEIKAINFDWLKFTNELPGEGNSGYDKFKKDYYALLGKRQPSSLIMIENPDDWRRESYLFDRGNWLTPTEKVAPGVPKAIGGEVSKNNLNRLEFAQWVASEENPLTSRTMVNRVWEQLFGRGIVRTVEDLGSQGELPTHPELLNNLSFLWVKDYNWSIKELIRQIVLSETYRQSAIASDEKISKDPDNKYLSRGPRYRLSAEQVRDLSLQVSGLLDEQLYGPPVMPFQPEGIWQTPYNSDSWSQSEGNDQYRRAIYTFIKRTSVYPSFETFDMAQRQVCTSRRIRTNSPLQALVTLNDPVYVEASEALAERMRKEGGKESHEQIAFGYDLIMLKPISKEKLEILTKLYEDSQKEGMNKEKAMALVANSLLNLDEALNK